MTRLEQIDFDSKEKFLSAIDKVLDSEDAFRSYTKDGEVKRKKIISKNRLYVGNNFSIGINQANNGKIYLSVNYFGADDRIAVSQNNSGSKNKSSNNDI